MHCQQCNDTHTDCDKRFLAFLSGNLGLLFVRLQYILNVFKFRSIVKSLSMPIESLLTTIFFLETKSLPSIPTKRYESEPNLPEPKLLFPNAGRSNRHCLSIEKTPNRQRSGKLYIINNVLQPRRLIAPSLLTTEIVARSKHSSSKKLLLHKKLPKPPKGASKLTSFCAILAVRMHVAVRAEGLLAPSSARFSVDRDKRCRLCKGLGSLLSYPLLVATLCFNPAKGPQTASRSADHELECRARGATIIHWHWIN